MPVAATLVEAVSLLQRGGLDCTFGVTGWLKAFGYADFAKYLTDYPLGLTGPAIGLMMNRDAWNKLTKDQKIAHMKGAALLSARRRSASSSSRTRRSCTGSRTTRASRW